jgi:competence ComEA-like helix-hairpin-helix protein
MFTTTEKKYLALTVFFLATGTGIKAYKHTKVKIGPMVDSALVSRDSVEILTANLDPASTTVSVDSSNSDPIVVDASSLNQPDPKPRRRAKSASSPKAAFTGKRSINHASAQELTSISGLGAKTAQFIVNYRNEHGPFKDLQELLQIKGIGEKKLEKFKPFLIL